MSEGHPTYDDEIDLFELFETLWEGKWLISTFKLITVLVGSGFLFVKEPVYESKLIYSENSVPPFYNSTKVFNDFQNKFYSVRVFEDWKKTRDNTTLAFDDFSYTEVVDGFIVSKDEDEQLVRLTFDKKGYSFVLVKSRQLKMLSEFFAYAEHINGLLKDEYVLRAKEELQTIHSRFNDLGSADDNIIQTSLSIDRYIVSANQGTSLLNIYPPTMPDRVSAGPLLVLALSALLGGIIGAFFVLFRNAMRQHQEKMAEA